MQELDQINEQLKKVLEKLSTTQAEDESSDELVSNLQELVRARQLLLDALLADESMTDRTYLQAQLELTRQFASQSTGLRADRQELLHLGSKSKRQINVYKTIDANR